MIATNHAVTGALIATAIDKPLLALPLALASHFALDALPHFGYPGHNGFGQALKYKISKMVAIADPLLLICLVVLLWLSGATGYIYLAALLAAAPDIEWLYDYFRFERSGKKPPSSWLAPFHKYIQWCERPWGIWVEAGWLTVTSLLLIHILQ